MRKTLLLTVMLVLACVARAQLAPGKVYRIISGKYSLFVENASLGQGANVVLWAETNVAAQRWIVEDESGKIALRNAYTGLYLSNKDGKIVQRPYNAAYSNWTLVAEEGKENSYSLHSDGDPDMCIKIDGSAKDGAGLLLADASQSTLTNRRLTFEEDDLLPLKYDETVRDDVMACYIRRFYKDATVGHILGSGGWWGDAECFEAILDAYETTGDITYLNYFSELFDNFVVRERQNWSYNEYNDDITWMVLASIRGYKFSGDEKYLNAAKSNFDMMYARAIQEPFGTLIWKQSQENPISTNSCINCPATVAAFYLGQLTGDKTYFDKAVRLYEGQRKLLFNESTGAVYDSAAWTEDGNRSSSGFNQWSSTYNQGTMLGAAIMMYEYTKDEKYKTDADRIHNYTVRNLCNGSGIVSVCQTVDGDLTGFKGIYMRYARRYAEDLGHPEALEWMAKNAWHAYQNRAESSGIIWSAWLTKTAKTLQRREGDKVVTCGTFSASTALSVAFNAHINALFYKYAYNKLGVEYFDEMQWMQIANPEDRTDDGTPETTVSVKDGAYIAFKNVVFGTDKANVLKLRVKGSGNSVIKVYTDSISASSYIGETDVLGTDWTDEEISVKPVSGNHHVIFVVTGDGQASLHNFVFESTNILYRDLTDNSGVLTIDGVETENRDLIDNDADTSAQLSLTDGKTTLVYTSPKLMILKAYALYATPEDGKNAPKAWTLEGSYDGENWVTLDEQTDKTFAEDGEKVTETIDNNGQGFYYVRLTVEGDDQVNINDWQLYGRCVAENDLTDDGGTLQGMSNELIDNDPFTVATAAPGTVSVIYTASAKQTLVNYSITIDQMENAPQGWTLEGSASGLIWTKIDQQEHQLFAYDRTTNFYPVDTKGYKLYRFTFDALPNNSSLSIADLQLFTAEDVTGISTIPAAAPQKRAGSKGVFDLQGRKVAEDAPSFLNSGSKGIFILDGKKIVR